MDNKKVIIIGGGHGIGPELCRLVAEEMDTGKIIVIDTLGSLEELKERGITIQEPVPYIIEQMPSIEMPFIPNQKIRSKYKRRLKYR